jgi:hypothetical protein
MSPDKDRVESIQALRDVERAAWYARLAFGSSTEEEVPPPVRPDPQVSTFCVMP